MTTDTLPVYTKKDFQTDQEVRWCPGCGDYAILSAVQIRFAGARHSARKFRGHFRHRLLQPLSLLHEHLRLPHHSRPRARPWPPASRSRIRNWKSGWPPATATRFPSAAITPFTCCAATWA